MELICSQCRKPFVKASRRQGGLDRLLSWFYTYPFRCQVCQHRFHLMQWGLRYIERDVDRREYERRPVQLPAKLQDEQGRAYEGTVRDLSVGGCAMEVDAPLQKGALLRFQLDALDNEPCITVETTIVRSAKEAPLRLEFLRMAPKEKERLSQFILNLWLGGTQAARKGTWQDKP